MKYALITIAALVSLTSCTPETITVVTRINNVTCDTSIEYADHTPYTEKLQRIGDKTTYYNASNNRVVIQRIK